MVKRAAASCVLWVHFNCDFEDCSSKQRAVQNAPAHLTERSQELRTSVSLKNVEGVNNSPLVPADVTKVIVPTLHCPMGLVDKLIMSFLDCVWQKVLLSPHLMMTWCGKSFKKQACNLHLWLHFFSQRKPCMMNPKHHQKTKKKSKGFKQEKNKAVMEERASANKAREKMICLHSTKAGSFTTRLEATHRAPGASCECCHGGKFSGVNCIIRVMDQ